MTPAERAAHRRAILREDGKCPHCRAPLDGVGCAKCAADRKQRGYPRKAEAWSTFDDFVAHEAARGRW